MKRWLRTILLIGSLALFSVNSPVHGGSLGDWFKKLGNSIAHPQKHPTPARNREKGKVAETVAGATPTPAATAEPTVRTASVVTQVSNPKRDIPYGIPVPDKPGLVTSPFAPNQGWVDVRGIPSGAEVKDPFTGKSFLTP